MKEKVMVDGQEQYLLKCNFHTHYAEFYGDKPEIMVDAYYEAGYNCIALTEHDDVIKDLEGEKRAQLYAKKKYGSDFLVIVGEEFAFDDRSNSGCYIREVLGLFLSEYIFTGRKSGKDISLIDGQKALNEVHRQGGVAVICHDNWLVWCLEYMGRGKHPWMWDFRHGLPIDGWEVGNGVASRLNEKKAGRDLMLSHPQESVDEGYIVLANSDAHKIEEFELSTDCYTYVLANQKTLQGVKEALLDRRTVAFCKGKMYGAEKLVCLLQEHL